MSQSKPAPESPSSLTWIQIPTLPVLPDQAHCIVETTGNTRIDNPSGRTLNRIATDRGLSAGNYTVRLGADPARGLITLTPVPVETPSSVALHWYRNAATVHLGAVFMQYPKLKFDTRSQCFVTTGSDPDGGPCLVIALHNAVPKRTVPRSKSPKATVPSPEAAAAEQK